MGSAITMKNMKIHEGEGGTPSLRF